MPWNEPGGNQQDPWTGKNRNNGKDGKDGVEEIINKLNQALGGLFGSGRGGSPDNNSSTKGIIGLSALLVGGWLVSGFYTVDARQQALVMRFSAYQETAGAGLHWHLPYPIETTEIIEVEQNRSAQDRSTMLTKDENIVDIAVSVQYKVRNPQDYAFNVLNVDFAADQTQGTLYQVMRGATREVVGRNDMDFILKEGREQIAIDAQNLIQKVLDTYKSGLQIIKVNMTYAEAPSEVKDAFDDANRAREDANRFQNEAETYAKKVVPEAKGRASRLLEEANGYKQGTIAKAEGDVARFLQLATEYRKAPEVTRERLYLETMENVMAGSRKVIIDTTRGNNTLYLPLDQIMAQSNLSNAEKSAAAALAATPATSSAAPSTPPAPNSTSTVTPSTDATPNNTGSTGDATNAHQAPRGETSNIREGR
ncbi:MAG: FtsH protease modulator HflK [Pseudomonadota bacterium]|jgi:membrane protease subunit HflK